MPGLGVSAVLQHTHSDKSLLEGLGVVEERSHPQKLLDVLHDGGRVVPECLAIHDQNLKQRRTYIAFKASNISLWLPPREAPPCSWAPPPPNACDFQTLMGLARKSWCWCSLGRGRYVRLLLDRRELM